MEENQHLPLADRFITFGGAVFNSGGLFRDLDASGTAIVPSGPWMWDPAKAYPNKVGGSTGSGYLPTIVGGSMLSNRINRFDCSGPDITTPVNGTSAVRT